MKKSAADRDSYLRRAWGTVDLYVGNLAAVSVNLDKDSFWNDIYRELISMEIGTVADGTEVCTLATRQAAPKRNDSSVPP